MLRIRSFRSGSAPSRASRGWRPAALAVALITSIATVAWAQAKIAVVDTQRAMMETEEGLRMQANLKKLFETKQGELDRQQKALEAEGAEIQRQKSVLSQDAWMRKGAAWQQKTMELQQKFVKSNQEMQAKQGEMTQPIYQKTMTLIARLARTDGYDIIVDKQAVPYARSDLDLTDRIITMYNRGGEAAPEKKDDAKPAAEKPAAKPAAPKK